MLKLRLNQNVPQNEIMALYFIKFPVSHCVLRTPGLQPSHQCFILVDRFRMVFFIMVVHGIGILMPWNMLINAKTVSVHRAHQR